MGVSCFGGRERSFGSCTVRSSGGGVALSAEKVMLSRGVIHPETLLRLEQLGGV